MATRKRSIHALDWEREQLGFKMDAYLRSHGWEHTSSTPSCHWLWRKKTPGGEILLVDRDMAISIQRGSCAIRGNEW